MGFREVERLIAYLSIGLLSSDCGKVPFRLPLENATVSSGPSDRTVLGGRRRLGPRYGRWGSLSTLVHLIHNGVGRYNGFRIVECKMKGCSSTKLHLSSLDLACK